MVGVAAIIDQLSHLPPMPASVVQLSALLHRPEARMDEIERVVARDEALTLAVLKAANSARFGAPGRVFSLRESVIRLGIRRLFRIGVEAQSKAVLGRGAAGWGLERGALWAGALGGAVAAESLSRRVNGADTDLCYVGALLRDIGKLALEEALGAGYVDRILARMTEGASFSETEREAYGFDHAEIGALLVEAWGLPARVASIVRRHHHPPADDASADPAIDVVHAADAVAHWAGLGIGDDGLQERLDRRVRESLRLDRIVIEQEIARTWSTVVELEPAIASAHRKEHIA